MDCLSSGIETKQVGMNADNLPIGMPVRADVVMESE